MAVLRSMDRVSSFSESQNTSTVKRSRKIENKLNLLDKKMDGLYRDIYTSRPDNVKNLGSVLDTLDTAIDNVQMQDVSVSRMSELLRRIDDHNSANKNVNELIGSVNELFADQNILNTLFINEDVHRYLSAQNAQFDMICKYLPKLERALKIKRDNVLCSENFSNEFINPISNKTSNQEIEKFSANVDKLERTHKIHEFFEKTFKNVQKYGEDFVYVVPYKTALTRVIKRTNGRRNGVKAGQINFYESDFSFIESVSCTEQVCLAEGFTGKDEFKKFAKNNGVDPDIKFDSGQLNIHFNDSNLIFKHIDDSITLEAVNADKFKSLKSIFESEGNLSKDFDKVKDSNDKLSAAVSDGLIIPSNLIKDPDKIDKNIIGAVLERIPRENIIPIYIGKICMGYYYFEFKEAAGNCGYCGSTHSIPGGVSGSSSGISSELVQDQMELTTRYIASKLSSAIDTHFINANKDLKEEIYAVLRYNEKFDLTRTNDIGVTFIPADDIVHCYFELDEVTHRGISELQGSFVPAMLYILLYLTDIIGKISRSTDRRIYYVKQNVETNVARTMMNVVQQIKKGNFGMRQIESMNSIFNIIGKYNDFIIPLGQSGEAPIQFEVMQGQDIQTPTEIMDKMEEMSINEIVPFELVNSTYQQDFAVRFSMTNSIFLKDISTQQRHTKRFLSDIYTPLYNYEFDENYSHIEVRLPTPMFLTMSNMQQLIDNISQQCDKIIEMDMPNEDENVKLEFKRIYMRNSLGGYLDFDTIERYKNAARVAVQVAKNPKVEESDNSEEDMSDYM